MIDKASNTYVIYLSFSLKRSSMVITELQRLHGCKTYLPELWTLATSFSFFYIWFLITAFQISESLVSSHTDFCMIGYIFHYAILVIFSYYWSPHYKKTILSKLTKTQKKMILHTLLMKAFRSESLDLCS